MISVICFYCLTFLDPNSIQWIFISSLHYIYVYILHKLNITKNLKNLTSLQSRRCTVTTTSCNRYPGRWGAWSKGYPSWVRHRPGTPFC